MPELTGATVPWLKPSPIAKGVPTMIPWPSTGWMSIEAASNATTMSFLASTGRPPDGPEYRQPRHREEQEEVVGQQRAQDGPAERDYAPRHGNQDRPEP